MWKIAGASVTGTRHQAAGQPGQDASAWLADGNLTCLAVADGAGSRPLSGQGSALAVQSALTAAAAQAGRPDPGGPQAWLRAAFARAREDIDRLARDQGRPAGDYATTLGVVILTEDLVCVGQVGDTIVVVRRDGAFETVAPDQQPEYVNETSFVTGPGALEAARMTVLPAAGVNAVFLSTDGLRFKILGDLFTAAPFSPFFDDLSAYLHGPGATGEAIGQFLAGLTDDQSGDDKTLVAAVRTLTAAPAGPGTPGAVAVRAEVGR
jgi:hypothetical protein